MPISDLLGGTFQPTIPLYVGIGIGTPEEMRDTRQRAVEHGYRRVQIKVSGGLAEAQALACEALLQPTAAAVRALVDQIRISR